MMVERSLGRVRFKGTKNTSNPNTHKIYASLASSKISNKCNLSPGSLRSLQKDRVADELTKRGLDSKGLKCVMCGKGGFVLAEEVRMIGR